MTNSVNPDLLELGSKTIKLDVRRRENFDLVSPSNDSAASGRVAAAHVQAIRG